MLRHLVVDLLVLAFTVFAVWSGQRWAMWAVGVYAVVMIVLKGVALFSGIRFARPADAPPEWLNHVLYAATLVVMLFGGPAWYPVAGAWAVLWVVMAYSARTIDRASTGA
jgi:hypothetical protein